MCSVDIKSFLIKKKKKKKSDAVAKIENSYVCKEWKRIKM